MNAMFDELAAAAEADLRTTQNIDVIEVADEVFHLLEMIKAVSVETRANNAALVAPTDVTLSFDAAGAARLADITIGDFGERVTADADARAKWQEFATSAPLADYERVHPQLLQILIERTQVDPAAPDAPAPAIETDPDLIIQVAAIAQTSMFRLEAFEAYGAERFADLTVRTTALGVRADRDVSHWIMLLVLVSGASVFFLGLMLWTPCVRCGG